MCIRDGSEEGRRHSLINGFWQVLVIVDLWTAVIDLGLFTAELSVLHRTLLTHKHPDPSTQTHTSVLLLFKLSSQHAQSHFW